MSPFEAGTYAVGNNSMPNIHYWESLPFKAREDVKCLFENINDEISVLVKLKHAKINDATAIVNLFKSITGRELDVEKVEACINEYPSVLALSNNELIGFTFSSSFAPDILELLNIAVLESYRYLGIGSMILNELEKQSADQYQALILVNSVLYPSNKPKKLASNFYFRNGYSLVHTTKSTNVFIKNLK